MDGDINSAIGIGTFLHGGPHTGRIPDITDKGQKLSGIFLLQCKQLCGFHIQYGHPVSQFQQTFCQIITDSLICAGDKYIHISSPSDRLLKSSVPQTLPLS